MTAPHTPAVAKGTRERPRRPAPPTAAKAGTVAAVALLAALPMIFAIECGSSGGSVRVGGGPHGDFVVAASDCHALAPYGRFGANVHGDGGADGALYVTHDPTSGTLVRIEVPGSCGHASGVGCALIEIPAERCRTFDAAVENTRTVVNDVRLVRGHAELDCALADGTRIEGRVDFDGC